ncbi:MAG: 3-deoxy-D-manno-octulosonic-acid transferase [Acidobacteria bacterium OLB17]|nr:MAG: 3-deoxy-D-manno-octulosonic-acid transferase [Acidobacteria bacterium OLB17]MCZ2390216.1 3-deoxy-D-manno-octulosonic acid transferase [Acidobacteriota bacterium]
MFVLYSLIYTLAFLAMLPVFAVSAVVRGKRAAGFFQRLGLFLPKFTPDDRKVVWLHCVSVGEANAARPLVDRLRTEYPNVRLIVSTTTRTGQNLAKEIFKDAAAIFYVPFDWRWTVRRAIRHFRPSLLVILETELWLNLIRESCKAHTRIALVNGRMSERSFKRYAAFKKTMKRLFGYFDRALIQTGADANRFMALGMRASKVKVTGNLKFDHSITQTEEALTEEFRERFALNEGAPLIIAASTHEPEEKLVLAAFHKTWEKTREELPRLMLVPRHPERFDDVARLIADSGFQWVRRSDPPGAEDAAAEVMLLDSIGELRAALPLAEIVFVGGSLIEHGGQSVLEPAAAGKAMITGPYTHNFAAIVEEFVEREALIQLTKDASADFSLALAKEFCALLDRPEKRKGLGERARAAMNNNRGAIDRTFEQLRPLIERSPSDGHKRFH